MPSVLMAAGGSAVQPPPSTENSFWRHPEVASAVLNSPDPTAEGRRQAVACARRLLTEDGVDPGAFAGVNLSGVGPTDPLARADFIVGIVQELGPLDPSG